MAQIPKKELINILGFISVYIQELALTFNFLGLA